jgi:3-methyladenine DNA glycosylase AlkD
MPMDIRGIQNRLRALGSTEAAAFAARYFKTGPGEYGAVDVFLGIRVPVLRKLAAEFRAIPLAGCNALLRSSVHEDRLLALLILTRQFDKSDPVGRQAIHDLYLSRTEHINNWDLVDVSAPTIVGGHLVDRDRAPLDRLASSTRLWERRISIVATGYFIRRGEFSDTFRIAERLLSDREDLIHKAVGWMLREVGKRDQETLEGFLQRHARAMPRTMLRYAIERLPEDQRQAFLKGSQRST